MKKIILVPAIILLVAAGTVLFFVRSNNPANSSNNLLDEFARCLSEKETVMYGTNVCPHCQEQKKIFGDSFQLVRYVDCFQNVAECQQKNIENVPTWIFGGGEKIIGVQSIEELSRKTGCIYGE
jgi:glutaredoxin